MSEILYRFSEYLILLSFVTILIVSSALEAHFKEGVVLTS